MFSPALSGGSAGCREPNHSIKFSRNRFEVAGRVNAFLRHDLDSHLLLGLVLLLWGSGVTSAKAQNQWTTHHGTSQNALCRVAAPTPLNVRVAPRGNVIGTLQNDRAVMVISGQPDASGGSQWVYVADAPTGTPIGWVARTFLRCAALGENEIPIFDIVSLCTSFYESEKSQRTPEFRLNKEKNTAECISRAKEHYEFVRHYWPKVPLADRASCAHKARELVKLVREDSVEAHPYVYINLAGCLSSAFCKGKPLPCAD
jgi:hypothetical protein